MAITITSKGYGDVKKSVNYGSSTNFIFIASVVIFSSVMLVWLGLFAVNFSVQNQSNDLSDQRAKLEKEKNAVKPKETKLLDVQKRISQINKIIQTHPNGKYLFDTLAKGTRGDVKFRNARVDFINGTLTMDGEAATYPALSLQLLALEPSFQNWIRSMQIKNIKRVVDASGSAGAVSFNLFITFDQKILLNKD